MNVLGSVVTAFIIGAGGASGVGLLAGSGTLNTGAVIGIVATGLIVAAKDYRSLMKLPPVQNGKEE